MHNEFLQEDPPSRRDVAKKEIQAHHELLGDLEKQLAEVLVNLQKSPKWQKYIVGKWEILSQQDKINLYNDGRPKKQMLANMFLLNHSIAGVVMSRKYHSSRLKITGFMEAPGWRWLVQAGLLSKPEDITDEQLKQDLSDDVNDTKMLMDVAEGILSFFAPETIPELTIARKIIQQIADTRKRIAELALESR
ncbi:MAG: hypothetical protein WC269_01285 [Candidatus Gracilibacteria bacterium]|jgi:hypothetical protein